jgi:hypothetical protein
MNTLFVNLSRKDPTILKFLKISIVRTSLNL